MTQRNLHWLWLLAAFAGTLGGLHAAEIPEYRVFKVSTPIVIDGRLDDPAWAAAAEAGPLVDNFSGEASSLHTSAKLLYDDDFLYFAFSIEDSNIWATLSKRDQHLWEEEVVEAFLQPDPSNPNYIELEVNPLGAMIDIYLLDIRKPLVYESWNSSRLQWSVQVEGTVDGQPGDRLWTCEIAFPLADAVTAAHLPPQAGDHWLMNLYRVDKLPLKAGLAWSPTRKHDFHVPSQFGRLVFTGEPLR